MDSLLFKPTGIRPLRLYEGIWLKLREQHKITLVVINAAFLPRLKRMISKEKDMDTGFKIINEVERLYLEFEWNAEKKELTVSLVSRFGLVPIVS